MIVRLTLVNQDPGATAEGLAYLLEGIDVPVVLDSGTGADTTEAWAWVDLPVTGPPGALRLLNAIDALGQPVRVEVVEP